MCLFVCVSGKPPRHPPRGAVHGEGMNFSVIGPDLNQLYALREDRAVGSVDRVAQLSAVPFVQQLITESLEALIGYWIEHELFLDDACLYTPVVSQGDTVVALTPSNDWVPEAFKEREGDAKRWRNHEFNFKRLTNPNQQTDNYVMAKMLMDGRYRAVVCSVYYPDAQSQSNGQVMMRPEWVNLTEHDKRRLSPAHASMKTVEKTDMDRFTGHSKPVSAEPESNVILLNDHKKK